MLPLTGHERRPATAERRRGHTGRFEFSPAEARQEDTPLSWRTAVAARRLYIKNGHTRLGAVSRRVPCHHTIRSLFAASLCERQLI